MNTPHVHLSSQPNPVLLGESLYACHQMISNYDVILGHTHILFLSEQKNCRRKDCKTRSSSR